MPIGEFDDTPSGFGRIAAQTARQVIHQRLRDVEDETLLGSFKGREGEIVSGTIQQGRDPQMVQVDLGEVEAVLPPHEQVPGEEYKHGTRLRVYIADVHKGPKGTSVTVSRTHPNLVRRLFALEAPEIADGTVEIVSLAREAGHRTKLAVRATKPGVNAKGSCIGELGSRVRAVMNELGQEKIDIVDYSDDPAKFVAHALSPAKATRVDILDAGSQESRSNNASDINQFGVSTASYLCRGRAIPQDVALFFQPANVDRTSKPLIPLASIAGDRVKKPGTLVTSNQPLDVADELLDQSTGTVCRSRGRHLSSTPSPQHL